MVKLDISGECFHYMIFVDLFEEKVFSVINLTLHANSQHNECKLKLVMHSQLEPQLHGSNLF